MDSHTQREIKILRSINEKVAAEKNQLAAEFERCKEQRDKLEANFSRLSNALVLQSHIDSLKGHIDSLNNDLYKAHNQIKDRDDSIKKLNEEIDALNIALDNHVHYDKGGKKSKNGDTLSRETLRDMCYNMAKKEAELHNMSVSLAEVFAKLEASKRTSEELLQDRDSFKMQLDESLNRFEILEDILEKTNEENNKLSKNNNSLSDTNLRLEQMIEDLSRRCSEARQGREECSEALSAQTAELKALKEEYQSAVSSLKKKIESAQVAMAHKDTVMAMCEQRLSYDRDQLTAEKEVMNDKLQRVDYLEREIEILRASSLSQIENRDEAVSQLQHELRASRSDLEQYRRELSESSSKTSSHDQLVQERDTLSNALQSAMATSKGVKAKLQHEIKRREVAEAALAAAEQQVRTSEENLKYTEQSKAQYSFAVLDAYQKEREKTAILEKELNFLRASVHNIDFGKRSKSSDQPHENNPMPPTPPESPIKETTPARANLPAISASSPVRQVDPKVAATRDLIGTIQRYLLLCVHLICDSNFSS